MPKTKAFDNYSNEYDNWFVENKFAFQSELQAIKKALPKSKNSIEIGIGSGIFAEALNIKEGIEPSEAMRIKAKERNINAINAVAENLPYKNKTIDVVLMVTTVCFLDDIYTSFQEIHRILKDNGHFVIGFVDKNSPIGKIYLKNKEKSLFYKEARFFSVEDLSQILSETGFEISESYQTIFGEIDNIKQVQKVLKSHGQGSFIVIKAKKSNLNK